MKNYDTEIRQRLEELDSLLKTLPQLVHAWRFAASMIFCLQKYYSLPASKASSEDSYKLQTSLLIEQFKQDTVMDDEWLRGFYYNSALMRLDALFERLFKSLVPSLVGSIAEEVDGPCVYKLVRDRIPSLPKMRYRQSVFLR